MYCLAWSPDSEAVAYGSGGRITIKPLTANTRQAEWVAHEGVVLSLGWCSSSGMLVSGGEDGRYKARPPPPPSHLPLPPRVAHSPVLFPALGASPRRVFCSLSTAALPVDPLKGKPVARAPPVSAGLGPDRRGPVPRGAL